MDTTQLDRQWRNEYRNRRYLEHASTDALQTRLHDVVKNAYFCHSDGLLYSKGDATKWMQLLSHILEESTLRGTTLKKPPVTRYKNARRAAELWNALNIAEGAYFVKFGELRYLQPMYEDGTFTIFAASKYSEPSLNDAIRDTDERLLETLSVGGTVNFIEGMDYKVPPEMRKPIPIIGPLKYTTEYDSNCYVACFSRRYEYRLFDEFNSDSCLVIRDPRRFIERLRMCSEDKLPGWTGRGSPVTYYDPYHPSKSNDVIFLKHFRYTYQNEYRVAWEPPVKQGAVRVNNSETQFGIV